MTFEEDEPFDSLGGNGPPRASPTSQLRKSTPSVPPAAAFGKSSTTTPNAPPAAAFGNAAFPSTPAPSGASQSSTPTPGQFKDEMKLPDTWENQMDAHRSESALGVDRSMASAAEREATRRFLSEESDKPTALASNMEAGAGGENQYTNYRLSSQVTDGKDELPGVAPRQPYSFKKSSSYDTNELIRKYGVVAGIPPTVSSSGSFGAGRSSSAELPSTTSGSRPRETSQDVRQEALEVLALVDDHLSSPLSVQRTRSGGYRATPYNNSSTDNSTPFDIRRSQSGGLRATPHVGNGRPGGPSHFRRSTSSDSDGKRVPSALSGLQFSSGNDNRSSWKAGRYSFTDPSFREDDDNMSVEDDIIHNKGSFQDEESPVIDVISLENRALSSRATSSDSNGGMITNDGSFDGDFPRTTPSSWSSRYSDTFANQRKILDQWDREYDNDRRTGARNMIMTTASSVKSAAGSAWTGAQSQSEKVFGPGFSFRKNFVFGKQTAAEKQPFNLRTAWKDIGEDEIQGSRVHKSWQEVMLSKKKRRRVLVTLGVILVAMCVAIGLVVSKGNNSDGSSPMVTAAGFGSAVSFYVTSDAPYDIDERIKLTKDLDNIPVDGDFLVHLGNIQKASETLCPWTRYANVASTLKQSPVPVFMLPGAQDWTLCPDPASAMNNWKDSFEGFEGNFVHGLEVFHDQLNPEAFAIIHKGVLFLGMHLVNGPVHNQTVWDSREVQMLTFYFGMTNVHKNKFRAVVVLGNARPSPQQDEFFKTVFASLRDIQVPLAYIHANSGSGLVREYFPVEDNPSIFAVEVEDGGKNPPLRITVGYGAEPFLVG